MSLVGALIDVKCLLFGRTEPTEHTEHAKPPTRALHGPRGTERGTVSNFQGIVNTSLIYEPLQARGAFVGGKKIVKIKKIIT